jgi:serine/threonine protein kinase
MSFSAVGQGEHAGGIKVLDFGLAKLADAWRDSPAATTVTVLPATRESREQAEGRSVDLRSDLFSLAVILYEMATGPASFTGGE